MNHPTPPFQPLWPGLLCVSGNGSKELLQGQLTCDLNQVSEGQQSCLGAHCNRQGKVISFFQIRLIEGQYQLYMPPELIPTALEALKKYAILYRGVTLAAAPEVTGQPASHLSNIHRGIPALYPATSEKFFAHELNLPALGAVSFDKGCYTGQEIIARMHYRGKPKRGLAQVTHSSAHSPTRDGDIFSATGVCGKVVDFAAFDRDQYIMLITAPIADTGSFFMDDALTLPLSRADQRSAHVR